MAFELRMVSSLWIFAITAVIWTNAQTLPGLPEELSGRRCSHERTINLPRAGKCLVPVSTAYDWTVAMSKCEQAQGKLYTLPPRNLAARPKLLRCLESIEGDRFDDMWINGVSLWKPQFKWINGSALNRVQFCPFARPRPASGQNISKSISVDYCVSQCETKGFPFTVIQTDHSTLTCYCVSSLSSEYRVSCKSPDLNFEDTNPAYIVPSNQGSLIDIAAETTFSTSEILCALIDNSTAIGGHLRSESCFNLKPFICDLTSTKACRSNKGCKNGRCNFELGNRCLQTVNKMFNWYSATDDCREQGGDLWVHQRGEDINEVSKYLKTSTKHWIGATNYNWEFDANSGKLTLMEDLRTARCAHIYRKRGTEQDVIRLMEWSDTPCDQGKSFLCEFDREEFREEDFGMEVLCPWKIIDPRPATSAPVVIVEEEDDSFPWRALISGIVASLMLLAALALLFPLCCGKRFRKPKDRVAFVPYFAGDTSQLEFETMSNADHNMRSNMRSASEHGSQTGLMKGYSSSHADFSSKSLDRRHLEAMEKKFSESQQYLANNSMSYDDKAYSSSYQTMPARGKEYMTLQANMTIQDEAELEAMRRSLRGKPEVTLVTDHMDMNFTVNHAHGNSRSDLSRSMDELHMHPPASGHDQRNRSFADIALHDM